MTGKELALLIAPYLGVGARDRLRNLTLDAVGDIAIRYDEITPENWGSLVHIMVEGSNNGTINLYDGEEWFILEPVGAENETRQRPDRGDPCPA